MKFNLDWSELDRSVRRMGAQNKSGFTVETERDAFRVILDQIKQGLEIDISKLEVNQGGLLAYKDKLGNEHHVLLYIKDHRHYLQRALDQPGGGNKFHVADCSTLQRMKSENKFDRYVVTNPDIAPQSTQSHRVTEGIQIKRLSYVNLYSVPTLLQLP